MDPLIAGFLSALVTLGATRLVDLLGLRQQHATAVRETVLARRLDCAETAASRLLRLREIASWEMESSGILARGEPADPDYLRQLRSEIEERRENLEQSGSSLYPFWLYFEVDEYVVLPPDLAQRRKDVHNRIRLGVDQLRQHRPQSAGDTFIGPEADEEEIRLKKELQTLHAQHAQLLRQVIQRYGEALRIVKNALAVYDPETFARPHGAQRFGRGWLRRNALPPAP